MRAEVEAERPSRNSLQTAYTDHRRHHSDTAAKYRQAYSELDESFKQAELVLAAERARFNEASLAKEDEIVHLHTDIAVLNKLNDEAAKDRNRLVKDNTYLQDRSRVQDATVRDLEEELRKAPQPSIHDDSLPPLTISSVPWIPEWSSIHDMDVDDESMLQSAS